MSLVLAWNARRGSLVSHSLSLPLHKQVGLESVLRDMPKPTGSKRTDGGWAHWTEQLTSMPHIPTSV